jgi:glutathione reductase (NADPH)
MRKYDYDLFTIGAGSGGVAASRRAGSYGARVGIAEESRVGGTCVIRGCVPKKLLVYGAQFADAFADAPGFGWEHVHPEFDWGALVAAKDKEIDRLNSVYLGLLEGADVDLFETRAVVVDAHTIELGSGRRVTAERILVATGGHPVVPAIAGVGCAITSNEALDLETLPRRIIIVGGGYIACEFAGIFGTLGAEVTMVIRGEELLTGFDDDVRATLALEMKARGIAIRARTTLQHIEGGPGGCTARTHLGEEISADKIMFATGRRPNTRGMGLEEVGVALDEVGAVKVDAWSRSSVANIYAVGDATDRLNLTPVAIAEGRALVETLYNDNPMTADHRNVPTAVFSQPNVSTVGLTEREARAELGAVDIYRTRFRPMKNILAGRDERTFMKLVVDRRTDRVVGAHMVGTDAAEIMQGLAIAIKVGATKKQFDQTIGIHPSAAEEFVTMREKAPDPVEAQAAN